MTLPRERGHLDEKTGITLTGILDEFLLYGDGSGGIVDYKREQRSTQDQGGLADVYRLQLNSYAYLCARADGLPRATQIGLV